MIQAGCLVRDLTIRERAPEDGTPWRRTERKCDVMRSMIYLPPGHPRDTRRKGCCRLARWPSCLLAGVARGLGSIREAPFESHLPGP